MKFIIYFIFIVLITTGCSDSTVKWSAEAKTVAQGICAFQYLNEKGVKGWTLNKLESEDKLGYEKVLNCANSFESKYHPQVFFNTFKSDTDKIAVEARMYLK